MKSVHITTEFIKLDSFLKLAGLISTGGEGKNIIKDGQVKVNGEICTMRGKKLRLKDNAEYNGNIVEVG